MALTTPSFALSRMTAPRVSYETQYECELSVTRLNGNGEKATDEQQRNIGNLVSGL